MTQKKKNQTKEPKANEEPIQTQSSSITIPEDVLDTMVNRMLWILDPEVLNEKGKYYRKAIFVCWALMAVIIFAMMKIT